MGRASSNPITLAGLPGLLLLAAGLSACQQPGLPPTVAPTAGLTDAHPTTVAIDSFETRLSDGPLSEGDRVLLYHERWPAVQRAVDHAGVTHDDGFYAARAYWHTGFIRGRGFAFEQNGDLKKKTLVDGTGAVRVVGDVNAPLEITGEATVLIYGDLNAPLTLRGNCEVIIAGALGEQGAVACDGTLHLFVGGPLRGLVGSTRGSLIIIDDGMTGLIRCGEPSTRITVTGGLSGQITPPSDAESVLTLRVDGYTSSSVVLQVMAGGFTRVNATLGISDSPPGLYPDVSASTRPPTSRWVVLRQAEPAE
ncbi:MAG: hypothetical protein AAGH88_07025 [Planctomycetota bacterium]